MQTRRDLFGLLLGVVTAGALAPLMTGEAEARPAGRTVVREKVVVRPRRRRRRFLRQRRRFFRRRRRPAVVRKTIIRR